MVAESYWPNTDGGATFARRLIHGLIDDGHDVSVWAPGTKFWRSYVEHDGKSVIYREKSFWLLVNPKYRNSYLPFFSGYQLLKRLQPDIIHLNLMGLLTIPTMIYAKRHRVPILAVNHLMPENILMNIGIKGGPLYPMLHELIWRFLVWFYNHTDYVVTPTPTAVKLLADHNLKRPLEAISNGVDMSIFKPEAADSTLAAKYHIPTNKPVVLYVGRVDGEKRIDLLIKSLPEVHKQQPCHLVIVGYGNHLAKLQDLAKELKVAEHVTFTGFIDEDDKPAIYRLATMFALASPAELQSIVMLEAMATGLPIVSVDVAALKELCHDGENGYLFARDDFKGLAKHIIALLGDPRRRAAFGQASQQIVREHHSTLTMIKNYEAAYEKARQAAQERSR